jgi:hypothetical protein
VLTSYILTLALNETKNNATLGKEYHIKDYDSSFTMVGVAPNRIHTSTFGSCSKSRKEYLPHLPGPLNALDVDGDIASINTTWSDDRFEVGTVKSAHINYRPLRFADRNSSQILLSGLAVKTR